MVLLRYYENEVDQDIYMYTGDLCLVCTAPVCAKNSPITALMWEFKLTNVFQHQHEHTDTGDTSRNNIKKIKHILVSTSHQRLNTQSFFYGIRLWNLIKEQGA